MITLLTTSPGCPAMPGKPGFPSVPGIPCNKEHTVTLSKLRSVSHKQEDAAGEGHDMALNGLVGRFGGGSLSH